MTPLTLTLFFLVLIVGALAINHLVRAFLWAMFLCGTYGLLLGWLFGIFASY